MRGTTDSAAAPAARCKNLRRGSFILNPPSAAFSLNRLSRLCVRADRQTHREHRAFAWLARHGHVTAHHARELAGDGKAKPGAAEALCGCGIRLAELLEQPFLLLRRHSDP